MTDMKIREPLAITAVLLLLAALIGVHDGLAPNQPRTERTPEQTTQEQAPPSEDPPDTSGIETVESRQNPEKLPPSATNQKPSGFRPANTQPLSQVLPATSTSATSEIRYIQSRTILETEKPDTASVALLRKAVERVASELDPPVIILDLDGLILTGFPFLLHADPKYDLTTQTSAVYREPRNQDTHTRNDE